VVGESIFSNIDCLSKNKKSLNVTNTRYKAFYRPRRRQTRATYGCMAAGQNPCRLPLLPFSSKGTPDLIVRTMGGVNLPWFLWCVVLWKQTSAGGRLLQLRASQPPRIAAARDRQRRRLSRQRSRGRTAWETIARCSNHQCTENIMSAHLLGLTICDDASIPVMWKQVNM